MPRRATIAPEFSTSEPTSAARPASRTVISPWLTTRAPATSPPPITSRPSRWKRAASMSWLAATMPPASMRAVSVKITPARFWMTTVPGRPQRALNHAAFRGGHPVQRGRGLAGLVEDHLVVATDVEALPVDHRPVRPLADHGARAALADRRLPAHDCAAGRALGRGRGAERRERRAEEEKEAGGGEGLAHDYSLNFCASYPRMPGRSTNKGAWGSERFYHREIIGHRPRIGAALTLLRDARPIAGWR